jgi:hypothetical protein
MTLKWIRRLKKAWQEIAQWKEDGGKIIVAANVLSINLAKSKSLFFPNKQQTPAASIRPQSSRPQTIQWASPLI